MGPKRGVRGGVPERGRLRRAGGAVWAGLPVHRRGAASPQGEGVGAKRPRGRGWKTCAPPVDRCGKSRTKTPVRSGRANPVGVFVGAAGRARTGSERTGVFVRLEPPAAGAAADAPGGAHRGQRSTRGTGRARLRTRRESVPLSLLPAALSAPRAVRACGATPTRFRAPRRGSAAGVPFGSSADHPAQRVELGVLGSQQARELGVRPRSPRRQTGPTPRSSA